MCVLEMGNRENNDCFPQGEPEDNNAGVVQALVRSDGCLRPVVAVEGSSYFSCTSRRLRCDLIEENTGHSSMVMALLFALLLFWEGFWERS